MIKTMSMQTTQKEEVDKATVAPEERSVAFASPAAISKSCKRVSFLRPYVKVASEAQIPRKQ
jgi:hypothetical protein